MGYAYTLSSITDYVTTGSSPSDVNSDLDIRVDMALRTYHSGVNNLWALFGQRSNSTGAQRKWQIDWDPYDGRIQFLWHNGTSEISVNTNPGLFFNDWQRIQVRATLDLDNGASGYDVNFYYRTDGLLTPDTGWGTSLRTVTNSPTQVLQTGVTEPLHIGEDSTVNNSFGGKWFRCLAISGLTYSGGTVIADVDFQTDAQKVGSTFVDGEGHTWSFVGDASWVDARGLILR